MSITIPGHMQTMGYNLAMSCKCVGTCMGKYPLSKPQSLPHLRSGYSCVYQSPRPWLIPTPNPVAVSETTFCSYGGDLENKGHTFLCIMLTSLLHAEIQIQTVSVTKETISDTNDSFCQHSPLRGDFPKREKWLQLFLKHLMQLSYKVKLGNWYLQNNWG